MESEETDLRRNSAEINEGALLPEVSVERDNQFKLFKLGSYITIEPILFALFFVQSLTDTVTVNFVLKRTCEIHFKLNKSTCSHMLHQVSEKVNGANIEIEEYSAVILTGMNFLSMLFPSFVSLFAGPWTDCNGRKLMIVLPAFGYFLEYIVFTVLSLYPNLGPEFVFLGIIPVILSGGFVNFISAAYAYISDISAEKDRSFRIGILEAVIFLGINIGYLSSSYIYKAVGVYGYVLIYALSAVIVLIVIVPTYFLVPESLQLTEKGKGLRHIFDSKLFIEMLKVCFKKREGHEKAVILLVITTLSISISTALGESNVIFLFLKLKFQWGLREFTLWRSAALAIEFFGLIFGIVIFIKWLKVPDVFLGLLVYGLKAATSFYTAFIPSDAPNLMFGNGLISIFTGLCGPVSRTILTKTVPKEDLGKVFALTSSSESIIPLAVGPLYTALYNATINTLPCAFLLMTGSLFILCFIFFIVLSVLLKTNNQTDYERMENENENENENQRFWLVGVFYIRSKKKKHNSTTYCLIKSSMLNSRERSQLNTGIIVLQV